MYTQAEWWEWLRREAQKRSLNDADAEDIVLLCLHAYHSRFGVYPWEEPQTSESLLKSLGWCKRKIYSLTIDLLRKPYRERELLVLDSEDGDRVSAHNPLEDILLQIDLELFIASLPCYLRQIAILLNQGYECSEIAHLQGLSVGTVRQYLQRIRHLGRKFFGIDVHESEPSCVNISEGQSVDSLEICEKEEQIDEKAQSVDGQRSDAPCSQPSGTTAYPRRAQHGGGGGEGFITLPSNCGCSGKFALATPISAKAVKQMLETSQSNLREQFSTHGDYTPTSGEGFPCIDLSQDCEPLQPLRQRRCRSKVLFERDCSPRKIYYAQARWKYRWLCQYNKSGSVCVLTSCGPWKDTGDCCDRPSGGPTCQGNDPLCPILPCQALPRPL